MQVKLLEHQWEAINTTHKFTCLLGGVGSGKTHTGSAWILKKYLESPDSLGLITANTYRQLRIATLASVFRLLTEWNIPFKYNQQRSMLTIGGKKQFLCLSLSEYDQHRGMEIGEWWADEVSYNSAESFKVISGRLRDNRGKLDCLFTTTPKGYNFIYDYFHPDGEHHKPDLYKLVKAKTADNFHLPDEYEETLRTQFDPKLLKQELEGEFVNVSSGSIYYAFDRVKHIADCDYNRAYPLWGGVDFNVNPMTATIGQIIGGRLFIIDEFYLHDSNTDALAKAIVMKYGNNMTLTPDSTGIKRTTNASKSDIGILKGYGFKIKSAANPYRVDRYAAVNGAFANGRVVISPRCKYTIKDLESVTYKEGTDQPDTTDKMLTHCSDNLGYLIYRTVNPLYTRTKPIRTQKR